MIFAPAGARGIVMVEAAIDSIELLRDLQKSSPHLLLAVALWDGQKDLVRLGDIALEHASTTDPS